MTQLIDDFPLGRFEDLIGQEDAARTMSDYVAAGGRRGRFLLWGPLGSGKTSLARITAKALLCQRRSAGDGRASCFASPCNACEDCREADAAFASDIDRHARLRYCDCGIDGDVATIRSIIEWSRYHPPIAGQRTVVVLDEAQELKPAASATLREVLALTPEHATFLLVTSARDRIEKSVRDRCTAVRTALLDTEAAETYARRICREKGFVVEEGALGILVELAEGYARTLITSIDAVVAQDGRIALDAVRRQFDLGHAATLANYLDAVLSGDLSAQLSALDGWLVEPRAKLAAIHRLLTFVYLNDVMAVHRPDRTLVGLPEARRMAIVAGFARRAAVRGVGPRSLWEEAISRWTIDPRLVAREALSERVIRFNTWMNPDLLNSAPGAPRLVAPGARPLRGRRSRARTIEGSEEAAAAAHYLTKDEARRIWDAGSFLAREYDQALNVWVRFDHSRLDRLTDAAGADLVGHFLHELSMAMKRWPDARGWEARTTAARPLRWICVHEASPGGSLISDVVAHVPSIWRRDLRHWLFGSFLPNKCGVVVDAAAVRLRHHGVHELPRETSEAAAARTRAHRRHTQLLRMLCRDLDPTLLGYDADGRRRSLVDLIGIKPRLRGRSRPIDGGRRVHLARAIGPGAQRRECECGLGPLSPFGDEAWAFLGCGWELVEFRDRARWRAELRRRRAVAAHEDRGAALALPEFSRDGLVPAAAPMREALRFDASWMRRCWVTWAQSRTPTLYYRDGLLVDGLDTGACHSHENAVAH